MSDNNDTTTGDSTDSTEANEDVLAVELVLGADRPSSQQVRLDVTSATVTDRAMGRVEITLAGGGVEEYLAELGLKHGTDEFATDGGRDVEQVTQTSKYEIPDDHWDEPEGDQTEWAERTSADVEVEVTLHEEGYQNDRRWLVHVHEGHRDHPVAVWAGEHQNKGNYWREPVLWRDAVDFVELPLAARQRVASMLNRSVDELTPDERMIHREDGTGLGDRAGDDAGTCVVCGGTVYDQSSDSEPIRHEDCVRGDGGD